MSIDASARFLGLILIALPIAALIGSSAAQALVLGDAVAQSALGSPLRVVIPVTAAPGELLQQACFHLVPAAGDGSAQIVTARVSLERAASAPRLVITTANLVNEPAIRFSVQGGCEGLMRRAYVLLLDPPAPDVSTAAAAQATVREPRQGQSAPQPAAARRATGGSPLSGTQVVHVPEVAHAPEVEQPASPTMLATAPGRSGRDSFLAAAQIMPVAFRQISAMPVALAAGAAQLSPSPPATVGGNYLWSFVALGVIALVALYARRRYRPPEIPQWTRGPSEHDTHPLADVAATPATRSFTHSRAGAATRSGAAPRTKPRFAATPLPGGDASAARSRPGKSAVDLSTIDTLLDELDPDVVEVRAVREAWAAARSDAEREIDGHASELDGNAILQAIEAAERDMQLAPPVAAQSAMERALDDDLLPPLRHS